MTDKVGSKNINVILVDAHVRVFSRHLPKTFVPEGHRVYDPVGLGSRRQMLAPLSRKLKRIAQNPANTTTRKTCFLDGNFIFCPFIKPSADIRILPLIVFTNYTEIDVARFPILQGSFYAREEVHRAKIHILVKAPSDRNQ